MLVCKLCNVDVEDYGMGFANIIPCKLCRNIISVCRSCADKWVIDKNALCVCCNRDKKIEKLLDE